MIRSTGLSLSILWIINTSIITKSLLVIAKSLLLFSYVIRLNTFCWNTNTIITNQLQSERSFYCFVGIVIIRNTKHNPIKQRC